jgi:hypothetical protein
MGIQGFCEKIDLGDLVYSWLGELVWKRTGSFIEYCAKKSLPFTKSRDFSIIANCLFFKEITPFFRSAGFPGSFVVNVTND